MEKIQLDAESREGAGKGVARALRREKRIPAVIYGDNKEAVMISLETKEVFKALHTGAFFTQLCDLDVNGTKHLVLARDVQLHPVSDQPVHADFMRVTERTKIKVNVPVQFINEEESPGLGQGGLLNTVMHTIEVFCRATKIPEAFVIDLTGTEMGDTIPFSALEIPEGVEVGLEDDFTIASVTAPAAVRSAGVDEEGEEGEEGAEGEEGSEEASEEGASDDA